MLDVWAEGSAYEAYIGRWSRLIAREYLDWLGLPRDRAWLDVGCGMGALSRTILEQTGPRDICALDRSVAFIGAAAHSIVDARCSFVCADAQELPLATAAFDLAVSGLVLNFIPDPLQALREMQRVVRTGGTVSAYVWDYAEGMELIRIFWEEARALDATAAQLDEARRFALCHPEQLLAAFRASGLQDSAVSALAVPTVFRDFDDYWLPFLGGQGPAPAYVAGLSWHEQAQLRDRLRARLAPAGEGRIQLSARAWAARGVRA